MGIQLLDRDKGVMQMIYNHGGILHTAHIRAEWWPESKNSDALRHRLRDHLAPEKYIDHNKQTKLFEDKEDPAKQTGEIDEDRTRPQAEGFYWLGWRGAVWIAQDKGKPIDIPASCESQERQEALKRQLAKVGITWRPKPMPARIAHDANINNVHVAITNATKATGHLASSDWIHEDYFRLNPQLNTHYPDAYFYITDTQNHPGLKARFLLELDRKNHDQGTLIAKFRDGLAFLKGETYREVSETKAGIVNAGRYLVVMEKQDQEGQKRLQNLIQKIGEALGTDAYVFLFVSFEAVTKFNPLIDPIWQPGDGGQLRSMLED